MIKNINLGINKTASKQSDIKNKYLKYKQKYLDLKELIGGYRVDDMIGVTKRILVLTDVGEEIDDEGALWMMLKSIGNNNRMMLKSFGDNNNYAADVVFCTGEPKIRRNRWATILDGEGIYTNIKYFYINPTSRPIRHHHDENTKLLNHVNLNGVNFTEYGNEGDDSRWEYDVVIQMSPLGDNNSPLGNLSKIKLRDGAETGSYILVGTEGSTNFDKKSPIHDQFKKHLLTNGFLMSIVAQENYANWTLEHTTKMNDVMKTYLYKDEWSKAIGRISPTAVNTTLFIRFRVNCKVNYDVIKNGFDTIENEYALNPLFIDAVKWWDNVNDNVNDDVYNVNNDVYTEINNGYIKKSQKQDKGEYGEPLMEDTIKGQTSTWINLLSDKTKMEFKNMQEFTKLNVPLEKCNINTVMSFALLAMTKRMAITYVFIYNLCKKGVLTNEDKTDIKTKILNYCNHENIKYMDFNNFPKLPKQPEHQVTVENITQRFLGNPEYDPSGMFVALALLAACPETRKEISTKLQEKKKLTRDDKRSEYFGKAYNNLNPKEILYILEQERQELLKENIKLIGKQRDASNEEELKKELERIRPQERDLARQQERENEYFRQLKR